MRCGCNPASRQYETHNASKAGHSSTLCPAPEFRPELLDAPIPRQAFQGRADFDAAGAGDEAAVIAFPLPFRELDEALHRAFFND